MGILFQRCSKLGYGHKLIALGWGRLILLRRRAVLIFTTREVDYTRKSGDVLEYEVVIGNGTVSNITAARYHDLWQVFTDGLFLGVRCLTERRTQNVTNEIQQ